MATATEPAARTAAPRNRLIGPMPRIGIRPAIDGRMKGVRESLEAQTLAMARSVADLLQSKLRHSNGLPVECVIPSRCIGGVAESAETAALFEREGVGLTLTVTPAWCYGAETMDMNPLYPKAVWGFNGTERPGAVYLAAVLAGHTQKGLPAFGIYGRDVQDAGDTTIPPDVEEKLLRFARAGIAVATMRGKSYLSIGGTSMGIAGSQVDPAFLEGHLGLRVEPIDMTEIARRVNEEIYDTDEYARAQAWVKTHCPEGKDHNKPGDERTRAQKDADWEWSIKMALIARDLMVGNPRLEELGHRRRGPGPQRHRRGVPGPAALDRPLPQRRLHGGHPQLLLRLERHPRVLRLRHRERLPQRHRDALRAPAHQHRPDLRRRADLLEPGGGEAGHRPRPVGQGGRGASSTSSTPGRRRWTPPAG